MLNNLNICLFVVFLIIRKIISFLILLITFSVMIRGEVYPALPPRYLAKPLRLSIDTLYFILKMKLTLLVLLFSWKKIHFISILSMTFNYKKKLILILNHFIIHSSINMNVLAEHPIPYPVCYYVYFGS